MDQPTALVVPAPPSSASPPASRQARNKRNNGSSGLSQRPKAPDRAPSKRKGLSKRDLGRKGEDAAVRFLYNRGYEIVERNWSCFAGEADIIARDGETLVFVEVKTRSDCEKGFPGEAVTAEKRDRYEKIALAFLTDYEIADAPVRFDVVSLVVISDDRALVRHHINAFCRS